MGGGVCGGVGCWFCLGALLGPEKTGSFLGLVGVVFFLGLPLVGLLCWGFGWVGGLFFEFCIVDASIFCFCCVRLFWCSQVVEGAWWMPWHQGPMKDVGVCDIPRGAGNQALIRGFPNGVTWHSLWGVAAV